MKVLVHYTTSKIVFNLFSKDNVFTYHDRIKEVASFFKQFNRTQDSLFFVICYTDLEESYVTYSVGKIFYKKDTEEYLFIKSTEEIQEIVCNELGFDSNSTYEKDLFYKTYSIDDSKLNFINKHTDVNLNKLKLKFFSWDELILNNKTLFKELTDIIFNEKNILKIASTYRPKNKYSEQAIRRKYTSALKQIGFISDEDLNTGLPVLHGDIGEFIMHIMLSEFLNEQAIHKYIYPKLVFKTSAKMAVYGNDGTIYIPETKEIYYLEAKFYSDIDNAITKAIDSLNEHNQVSTENIEHRIELFRNIKTNELEEVLEIDENVTENLVIFVMGDSLMRYNEILSLVNSKTELTEFKQKFNVVLFVLPVIDKSEFLVHFKEVSKEVKELLEKVNEK